MRRAAGVARVAAQGLFVVGNRGFVLVGPGVGAGEFDIEFGASGAVGLDGVAQTRNAGGEIGIVDDLGGGDVQLAFAAGRKMPRVERHDFAAIRGPVAIVRFRQRRQQIAIGPAALDVVVGHDDMHGVIGAALGHVTGQAILRRLVGGGVATLANFDVPPGGRFARVLDVGIVASGAGQRLIALPETGGFHEPVGGSGDFELVILAGARRVVEVQNIVLEGLAWAVGKHGAAVAAQRIRKRGGWWIPDGTAGTPRAAVRG